MRDTAARRSSAEKPREGNTGSPESFRCSAPAAAATSSGEARRDAQGAAERGEPQRGRESFDTDILGGSSHPRSRHHTAPRFPGLPPAPRGGEARPGPADPWVHSPDQICFLGKFDLLLGPDTFQTLSPLFYCITFFKTGRGDPAVPRASLSLPVN